MATSWHSRPALVFLCFSTALLTFCGGGSNNPSPPVADFTMSLSPARITQQAGGDSSQFTVLIVGQNGFSGSVNIGLAGLPAGITASPVSPFVVAAGASQVVTLSIPRTVATGDFQLALNGTSGTLTHAATLPLHITPPKDFILTLSPAQIAAIAGTVSPPLSVLIAGQNGFADTSTITLSGLPPGATSQPASPFTLAAGQNQAVTISVPAAPIQGSFSVQVDAISGSLSHHGQIGFTLMTIKTSETGTMLFLQTDTSTQTARIGLFKDWGGAITEASLDGTDYVNNDDPGRQIQTSLWDGNANYTTSWGYNPIESGDHFFHGSPLLTKTLLPDSIYTQTQPIQWAPENFGGGTAPVLGDAYIEKTISVVPGYNKIFKVHYKITHFGTDSHAQNSQELPVVYVNPIVSNFVYYGGNSPWTNGALTQYSVPAAPCCTGLHTPEQWGAYVDSTNTGLALYTPMQFPDSQVFNAGSTLQLTPLCPYSWDPGSVLEFDTYILVGAVEEMRTAIYALHSQQSAPSPLPPWIALDFPATGDTLTGSANVAGWAWSLSQVASVGVFLDGNQVAAATYGLPRPDVSAVYPEAPDNTGFQYSLDTTKFPNGSHAILVKATDVNGHVATVKTVQVTISN